MYYETHFGLNDAPFSISPDPHYLYLTTGHREALAHLLYGVTGGGGFVLLTGEVGAGKTTVCRCLLQQLPEAVDVALVLNPKLNALEFLETICDELGIEIASHRQAGLKLLVDYLYKYLLVAHSKGRSTVLIVDEAQNLAADVIEHLRLLTNLETDKKKLLQIILIGQPELRNLLDSPALRQMAQRITARFHMGVLSRSEAEGYIQHRLKVAGCDKPLFNRSSIKYIWKRASGVPRLMNAICDRALLGASLANKQMVTTRIAIKAAGEVLGEQGGLPPRRSGWFWGFVVTWLCLIVVLIAVLDARGTLNISGLSESPVYLDEAMSDVGSMERIESSGRLTPGLIIETPEIKNHPGVGGDKTPHNLEAGVSNSSDIATLLQSNSGDGEFSAYQSLFKRWGIVPALGNKPDICEAVENHDLGCLTGNTNLQTLVALNRPAVLNLNSESDRPYKVALLSLEDNKADINLFGHDLSVSTDKLLELWAGGYLIMWQPPAGYTEIVKLGMEGDVVEWISQHLSIDSGDVVRVYDQSVRKQIESFQRKYGLEPDGEVGPKTVVAINNFIGLSVPVLKKSSGSLLDDALATELSEAAE